MVFPTSILLPFRVSNDDESWKSKCDDFSFWTTANYVHRVFLQPTIQLLPAP